MNLKKIIPIKNLILSLISSSLIVSMISILSQVKSDGFKRVGLVYLDINLKTATANAVTSVVTFFRGIDTVGEVTVLFLATTGVVMMLSSSLRKDDFIDMEENFILNKGSKLLFSVIILFGVYIIVHGHLSPGGGFQGGVVIATAFLLLFLANPDLKLKHSILTLSESLSGVLYVLIALIGLFKINILLGNFLPHPVSQMGELVSGGIIPLIYILVGIKVASEMTVIVEYFIKEEAIKDKNITKEVQNV